MRRPLLPLATLALFAACGGNDAAHLGLACQTDADCGDGLVCARPLLGGSDRYCAPPCDTNDDCAALAATSYAIGVPDTVTPLGGTPTPTVWRTKTLARGVTCAPLPSGGGGAKYCQFACGNFMAVSADDHCYCLPGYGITADKRACAFGSGHQCSIFSYGSDAAREALRDQFGLETQAPKCTACNSDYRVTDGLGCHTGEFFCDLRTTSMNGECTEVLSTQQLNQCIAQKTNFACTCSDACAESCDALATCAECCTCTPTSAPLPKPTCSGGGPVDGGVPPDLARAAPDLATGGVLVCEDVYQCYFHRGGSGCYVANVGWSQACLAACDAQARMPGWASDAEALLSCAENAYHGTCATTCSVKTDAGVWDCEACIYGLCDGSGNCQGGACSTKQTTCYHDR